jgi:hypothetical protein
MPKLLSIQLQSFMSHKKVGFENTASLPSMVSKIKKLYKLDVFKKAIQVMQNTKWKGYRLPKRKLCLHKKLFAKIKIRKRPYAKTYAKITAR